MTIPNRTVSITGVFAEDALTTIPATPIPGTSYRDTAMTSTAIREGWAFKTIVDSAQFNQALYEYSSVTSQVEKYGFLPWSSLTDYVQGSVTLGSDGMLYQAKQATGPSSTAVDPTTDSSVWQQVMLGNTNWLFKHEWSDYEITRQDWLRADTFSWQPGTTYTEAYNHLVDDIDGITPTTETVGSYTITYYPCADGHKVVLADQESTVLNIYNESGVAWYYILDTVNTRFKLPRENPAREELKTLVQAPVVGNGYSLGLISSYPNGAVSSIYSNTDSELTTSSGGGIAVGSSNNTTHIASNKILGISERADKSGLVAKLDSADTISVSYYKGQKYLYFYIGQFSQSATEQTAGLNSSLFNGKLDLDAGNATSNTKETIVGWGMPDFSAGVQTAANTDYIAPSNGLVFVLWNVSTNKVYINDVEKFQYSMGYNTTFAGFIPIPVFKGTKIKSSSNSITFYPCVGG